VFSILTNPGRRHVSNSPHRKKHLSSDARVIKELLEKQPQTRDELCKNAQISLRSSYFTLPFLESLGIIKETSSGYALKNYDEAEEIVVQTVKQWRRIAFRDPLPTEIADATGLSPEKAENLARKTRDKTGWFMPNEAILDNATEKLGEVLGYLARKRDGKLSSYDYKRYASDSEVVKEAEIGQKEHLEMLPTFDEDDKVSWPSKALKYLRKNYELKERNVMVVIALRFG
jgi:hypothetical protein